MSQSTDIPLLTLREKQSLFARLIAQLILWVYEQNCEVTLADGSIDPMRKYRDAAGVVKLGTDAVHMKGSLHYLRLAQDLNLFIGGDFITGMHPAWKEIGFHWKGMNHLCRWGGDFASVDLNHFSLFHDGKA